MSIVLRLADAWWHLRRRGRRRIVLFGDSHTAAISRALIYRNQQGKRAPVEVYRIRKEKDGVQIGEMEFQRFCRLIAGLNADDLVFSAIGGNQYAVVGTVRADPDFRIVMPGTGSPEADASAEIVPYRAVRSYIASGVFNSDGIMLETLRKSTPARVFHLTPPPPKSDNDFIRRCYEGRFANPGTGEMDPTDPALRLACWQIQRDCLEEMCARIDVELLPPPVGALGEDGFLVPDCYANDATHANRRYGDLVLRAIATIASRASKLQKVDA